ncbi:MAG: Ig-like domain-containing protein, partial [Neisseriaceae bacterium]
VTPIATGSTTIRATFYNLSGNSVLNVVPGTLSSIQIQLSIPQANEFILLGTKQQLIATGTFSDGTTEDLTMSLNWSSSNSEIAIVSNMIDDKGLVTASSVGSLTISCNTNETLLGASISTSIVIIVVDSEVKSIEINPSNASIPLGTTQQFSAIAILENGSHQDISQSVDWSSSIAEINNNGLFSATTVGSCTISASFGDLSGSTNINVTNAILKSIAITPANQEIPEGLTQHFTATGTYSDGTTSDITNDVTWISSNTDVIFISNASGSNGLASTISIGSATISATLNSVTSTGGTVIVTNAILQSIETTPANPTISKGLTQQFNATGTYSDGTTQNITSSVIWDSSNTTVISVGNTTFDKGFGIARESGTAIIKASLGSISSSDNFITVNLNNQWIWLSGSSTINQNGNYGTKGVANENNLPSARRQAISWVDNSGNLLLFGGYGLPSNYFNDLWKYDISQGQWVWLSGSSNGNQKGNYGTKGVATASNVPGARHDSVSWVDSSGNLLLFGGYGYHELSSGFLNDLWKYDISQGQWVWVSGSNTGNQKGNYGIKGIASDSNVPGARMDSVSWVDNSGNLLLFGGYGYDESNRTVSLNDLWKYDISKSQWVWVSGSNTGNQKGNYGIKGIASDSNVPGARAHSLSWVDNAGNLLLFGGYGYDESNSLGYLNDLWKYDTSQGKWVWVSGSNTRNQKGNYGIKGVAADSNVPGARGYSVSWLDKSGNLLLFGGHSYDESNRIEYLNDLWKYDTSQGQWIWLSGSSTGNQKGNYGTKGIAAESNVPGARFGDISWIDNSGNLLLFGGQGYDESNSIGHLNDLWKYNYNH